MRPSPKAEGRTTLSPAKFALHRPEFLQPLMRGEEKIPALMSGSAFELPAGETLIEGGTNHPYIYRLISGWVCRTRLLEDGRNQFILIFLPGDLFGVKSMFITRHTDSVAAISPSVVERIHYRTLHDAYVRDSDVSTRCVWQVMEEERRLHSWVVGLGQGNTEERLALLLVDFRGRLINSGTIEASSLTYPMPLTQGQLADHLGITAVHINRVLKEFRDRGIVTVRDGHVSISDLDGLTGCAAALLDTYERHDAAYVGHGRRGSAVSL